MRVLHNKKIVFVSKPRCGSTSMRRFLDLYIEDGDIKCDSAGETVGLHPHMSAPSICKHLLDNGYDAYDYTYFTVIRNPYDMLVSYYKYFKPDFSSNYNYSKKYDGKNLVDFESWVMEGKVGLQKHSMPYYPSFITDKNLTPLSLEAHMFSLNHDHLPKQIILKLEEYEKIKFFLDSEFGSSEGYEKTNSSDNNSVEFDKSRIEERIKTLFPTESDIYNIG